MEKGRLRWHCRRGLLELDVIFERFLKRDFDSLTPAQSAQLANLVMEDDYEVWNMITGRKEYPAQYEAILPLLQKV